LGDGFTRWVPSVLAFALYGLSIVFLTLALRKIGIATAYAIWSGIGTAAIAVIGITYFKEPANIWKVLSLGLIILGVVGLNLTEGKH
jgi:small multidrug resistance pump